MRWTTLEKQFIKFSIILERRSWLCKWFLNKHMHNEHLNPFLHNYEKIPVHCRMYVWSWTVKACTCTFDTAFADWGSKCWLRKVIGGVIPPPLPSHYGPAYMYIDINPFASEAVYTRNFFFSTACRTACKHAFRFFRVLPEAVSTRHSWLWQTLDDVYTRQCFSEFEGTRFGAPGQKALPSVNEFTLLWIFA